MKMVTATKVIVARMKIVTVGKVKTTLTLISSYKSCLSHKRVARNLPLPRERSLRLLIHLPQRRCNHRTTHLICRKEDVNPKEDPNKSQQRRQSIRSLRDFKKP